MTSIIDRYASAMRSSNLRSNPDTTQSDSDVLGAAGLAGKREPLAMALLRLLSGDNHATRAVVEILGGMADGKAYRLGIEITRVEAEDMGRGVLAWYRRGNCPKCSGLRFERIEGAPALSERACFRCRGTGTIPFDDQWPMDRLDLARWLLAEMERELAKAGPAAMASLAPCLRIV